MSDCVVLPFPSRAKPRPYVDTLPSFEELLFDASADLPMGYFASDAITGHNNPIEPRAHFGLRRLEDASHAALEVARDADARSLDRVRASVRRAKQVEARKLTIDPSLLLALAGKIHGAAETLSRAAEELKAYGLSTHALTAVDLADHAETLSVLIEGPAHVDA